MDDNVDSNADVMFMRDVSLSNGDVKNVGLFNNKDAERIIVIKNSFIEKDIECFFVEFMVSDEDAIKFAEAITSDESFLRRSSLYTNKGDRFILSQSVFEMFEKVSNEGAPPSIAALFAMICDGNMETFDYLMETGAAIEMDNETAETTFEIFANMVKKVGIELAIKIFEASGYSIQEQRRYAEAFGNLSEISVENLIAADNDSIFPIMRLLSCPVLSESEAELVTMLTHDLNRSDWVKIGKISQDIGSYSSTASENEDNPTNGIQSFSEVLPKKLEDSTRFLGAGDREDRTTFLNELTAVGIHKFGFEGISKAYDVISDEVINFLQLDVKKHDPNIIYIETDKYRFSITMLNLGIPEILAVASGLDTELNPLMLLAINGFEENPENWRRY